MHAYATNASDRDTAPLYIGFLAVASAWALGFVLSGLNLAVPWWIDVPSVMGFYGLYRSLFDRYIWSKVFSGVGDRRKP
ncbi:MAG: hypothetical protein KatS3mg087_0261 [Patescibacteria group bacterium]|nr:MAG: hypothetical protein KatS3mg087_0261 [Patescibacteria group bacterium]